MTAMRRKENRRKWKIVMINKEYLKGGAFCDKNTLIILM